MIWSKALMQGCYRHSYSGLQLNVAINTTWMMAVVRKWRIFFAYLSARSVKTNTVSMQNLTDVVSSFPHARMHRCTQGVYVTAFGGSGKGTRNHLNQNTEWEAHASDIWCSLPLICFRPCLFLFLDGGKSCSSSNHGSIIAPNQEAVSAA